MASASLLRVAMIGAATSLALAAGAASVGAQVAPPGARGSQVEQGAAGAVPAALPAAQQPEEVQPQDVVVVPAPAGSASAAAVRAKPIDSCVGCADASATHGDSHATGTALRVGGHDVSAGHKDGSGDDHGNAFAFPSNPILDLAVASWAAAAAPGAGVAKASLVDLDLGKGQVVAIHALEGASAASWSAGQSHGQSETNGLRLVFAGGKVVVILMHSEASSDHAGRVYVIGFNDTHLGETSGGPGTVVDLRPVISVLLLQALAGGGAGSSTVGSVHDVVGTTGEAGAVLATSSSGQGGGVAAPVTAVGPAPLPTVVASPVVPATGVRTVPSTGAQLGLGGLVLVLGGGGLALASLRRRSAVS